MLQELIMQKYWITHYLHHTFGNISQIVIIFWGLQHIQFQITSLIQLGKPIFNKKLCSVGTLFYRVGIKLMQASNINVFNMAQKYYMQCRQIMQSLIQQYKVLSFLFVTFTSSDQNTSCHLILHVLSCRMWNSWALKCAYLTTQQ